MSDRPLQVLIVTPLGRGGKGGIDRIMDAVADRLANRARDDVHLSFGVTRGSGDVRWSPFLVAGVILRLSGCLLGRGPDVAHINVSQRGSVLRKMLVARSLRLFGVPYLIHLHGSEFRAYWDKASPLLSAEIHAMFVNAACTVVLGRVWRDYILGRVPEIADRIRVLPNASQAPAERAERMTDRPTILFLGFIGPRKGIPQLVEALTNLRDKPGWQAVIAGNGDVERTRATLVGNGLGDRVTVPGWVGPAEVERLLGEADILVLPSLAENLPMSVIEGMAHGLAVVTTPVGATEDIICDGETGLLVPPGDAVMLTQALTRLIADQDLRHRLGRAARAYHRDNLEMDSYVDRLVEIWRSAACDRRT